MRKLPLFRPTTSNLPRFSAPPLLEVRAGLPLESSAIFGARFRASSTTFAPVPRTRTVSARCSPGFKGEESASSSSPTSEMENGCAWRFAQETSTATLPGFWSRRGLAGRENGRGNPPCAPRYRTKNHSWIQRRHEERPARRIRRKPVPVREIYCDARSQPPVHIQHRERGSLARNDFSRQQQYPRAGSGGRLLRANNK